MFALRMHAEEAVVPTEEWFAGYCPNHVVVPTCSRRAVMRSWPISVAICSAVHPPTSAHVAAVASTSQHALEQLFASEEHTVVAAALFLLYPFPHEASAHVAFVAQHASLGVDPAAVASILWYFPLAHVTVAPTHLVVSIWQHVLTQLAASEVHTVVSATLFLVVPPGHETSAHVAFVAQHTSLGVDPAAVLSIRWYFPLAHVTVAPAHTEVSVSQHAFGQVATPPLQFVLAAALFLFCDTAHV